MDNNIIIALQKIAIYNVTSYTIEWLIERSYRHYSRTYNTPLHLAKSILTPQQAVLIFFEDSFADLPLEQQQQWKQKLLARPDIIVPQEERNNMYIDEEAAEEADLMDLINHLQKQEQSAQAAPFNMDQMQKTINNLKDSSLLNIPEDTLNFDLKD